MTPILPPMAPERPELDSASEVLVSNDDTDGSKNSENQISDEQMTLVAATNGCGRG